MANQRLQSGEVNGSASSLVYLAPSKIASRWQVSRSTVDRVARREGWQRLYLGCGVRGNVRYLFTDVIKFEAKAQA